MGVRHGVTTWRQVFTFDVSRLHREILIRLPHPAHILLAKGPFSVRLAECTNPGCFDLEF